MIDFADSNKKKCQRKTEQDNNGANSKERNVKMKIIITKCRPGYFTAGCLFCLHGAKPYLYSAFVLHISQ